MCRSSSDCARRRGPPEAFEEISVDPPGGGGSLAIMMKCALSLVEAFVEVLSDDGGYAVLRQRGRTPGYVHVVPAGPDPNRPSSRHVAIELFNGTIAVTEELREALAAHPRPNARIEVDPIGYSAGPSYGRFKWALTHDEIITRWGTERAFAEEVAKSLRSRTDTDAGNGDDHDEGDYR